MSGRPGPVVLALPHDMLPRASQAADVERVSAVEIAPKPDDIAALEKLIAAEQAPDADPGRQPLER